MISYCLFFVLIASAISCEPSRPAAPLPAPAAPAAAPEPAEGPDYPLAEWVGPSCDLRPTGGKPRPVDLIVIHTCEGRYDDCWGLVSSCREPPGSAHYVVRAADGHVAQAVSDADVAWHAGCANRASIGVEHEGYAGRPAGWFTDELYCGSARLVRWLADRHGVPLDRSHIVGHDEVNRALCGGTHWDPGPGWDWDYYMTLVVNGCGD